MRDYDDYSNTSGHVSAIIRMRKRINKVRSKALRGDDNDQLVRHSTAYCSRADTLLTSATPPHCASPVCGSVATALPHADERLEPQQISSSLPLAA
jgi:hypothetical protein